MTGVRGVSGIVEVTEGARRLAESDLLRRAERVHRQLRPGLAADYAAKMQRVFAGGGRMCVALGDGSGDGSGDGEVCGVAVYRIYENTVDGRIMYVDDLVTDESRRSSGIGHALMEHLQGAARRAGCVSLALDSGTHRQQAHKFYFREGMVIPSFHFAKSLK